MHIGTWSSHSPLPGARSSKKASINKANCFSGAHKSEGAGFLPILASGVICHICGEQLGLKANQETQQRPHWLVPATSAMLNFTTKSPQSRDSSGVRGKAKKDKKKKTGGESKSKRLRNPSTGFRKWHHCFFSEWCGWSYSTVSTTGYQTFKAVHRLQSNSCKSAPSNKQSNSLLLQFSIRHYSIKDGQFMVSLCSISRACSF